MANIIIDTIRRYHPDTEAVYLFGGYGTEHEGPESDVDLALLLPPAVAKAARPLAASDLRWELEEKLGRVVDLINLRRVDTVFQHEIIQTGRVLYQRDEVTVEIFEMTVMGLYQKLNEERAEIVAEIIASGRVLG